jgi:hypothetical protein
MRRCCSSSVAGAILVALSLAFAVTTARAQVSSNRDGQTSTSTPRAGRGEVSTGGGSGGIRGGARLEAVLTAGADGDPELSGSADLVVDPRRGMVCFDIDLDGVSSEAKTVVAVHIHPGQASDPCNVEDCAPPLDLDFASKGFRGCARAGAQLLSSLVEEPEQFYLHVHTARFPAGAVSGQLEED